MTYYKIADYMTDAEKESAVELEYKPTPYGPRCNTGNRYPFCPLGAAFQLRYNTGNGYPAHVGAAFQFTPLVCGAPTAASVAGFLQASGREEQGRRGYNRAYNRALRFTRAWDKLKIGNLAVALGLKRND